MPLDTGVSPGTPVATSGQQVTSPAPGATTSGPQDSPDAKELRRKITSQAEEIKRLRGVVERVEQNPEAMKVLRGETAPTQDEGVELEELSKKLWESGNAEDFTRALKAAAELGERRATDRVRQEMAPFQRRQVADTFSRKLNEFFGPQGKDLPDLAEPQSDFTRFLASEIRAYPWLRDLVDNDLDAAVSVAWERYVRENGDPAAEKARRLEHDRRSAASLEDSTGVVPGLSGIVQVGGNKSLLEIFQELESRGS